MNNNDTVFDFDSILPYNIDEYNSSVNPDTKDEHKQAIDFIIQQFDKLKQSDMNPEYNELLEEGTQHIEKANDYYTNNNINEGNDNFKQGINVLINLLEKIEKIQI